MISSSSKAGVVRNVCVLCSLDFHSNSRTSSADAGAQPTQPFHLRRNKLNICMPNAKSRKCSRIVLSSSSNRIKHYDGGRSRRRQEEEEDGGVGEKEMMRRKVSCQVEVISWRERRVKAQILVNSPVQSAWNALTDYERLADFIPNLVSSGRIPCPHPGRIWLEQRGLQRALYWHIEARVVLDLQEFLNSDDDRELHFSMVDGDFKKFEGKWSMKTGKRSTTTILSYEVNVIPRFNFPAIFLERIIRSDLPVNLQALACRAERDFQGNKNTSVKEDNLGTSTAFPISSAIDIDCALSEKNKLAPVDLKDGYASSPFGHWSPSSDFNSKWGVFGQVCQLDRPCTVDEIHLRRFDGLLENGGVHRCVVASITVKAPVREVWNVLTAYESLPEIVPNLAISKILSRDNNRVRILQEGCKGLLYMVLHARVVLDLCEKLEREISFEQAEGDFDFFQGKWLLEQLGNHHTLLKYTVESKMQKNCFLSEAIMEEVIYEDLPSNLCAIRDYVEKRGAQNSSETCDQATYTEQSSSSSDDVYVDESRSHQKDFEYNVTNPARQRPHVPGLQRDIEVLKAELLTFISENGQEGFMPMRKQLRKHGRVDIEKAITRMGGFRSIASLMNLSLAYKHRKPKGYWDNLENLQEEISRFQRSWGMDPSYMPSRKCLERAGRYDIARALEKWGGLHEVSRLLSLKVRHPNKQGNLSKDKRVDCVTSNNVANGEVNREPSSKPYASQDAQKWLMKLKGLDIT